MKLKHLLLGLFAVATTFACQEVLDELKPSLEVSKDAVSLEAVDGEASFDVTSNQSWTATADADWIEIKPASGDASETAVEVKITAVDNPAEEVRTASITVKAGELTKTVSVTQAAGEAEDPGEDPGDDPVDPAFTITELYMLGGACDTGWSVDIMTAFENVEGLWVWEGNLKTGGEGFDFRFPLQKVSGQWWPCLCPNDEGTAVVLGEGDGQVSNAYRVPSDGYYKITVNPQDGALTIERTGDYVAPTITVTELYVLGSACDAGWSLEAMTAFTNDNGVFTWTGNLKANEEFRFPLQNGWWPSLMISEDGSGLVYGLGDDEKVVYHVAETGVYTITVDVRDWNNRSYTIEKVAAGEPEVPACDWAIVGSINDWNTASDLYLSLLEDGSFVYYGIELTAGDEFKFLKGGKWSQDGGQEVGGNGDATPNTIQTSGGMNIKVTAAGKYDIYLAADLSKFYIMDEGKLPSEAVEPTPQVTELYMLGSACDTGWSIDDMTAFTNDNSVFTWTGNLKANEEFRFPLQKVSGQWWPCLMINDDGSEIIYGKGDDEKVVYHVAETGVYTITVDVRDWNNRSYTIEKAPEPVAKLDGVYWIFGTKDGVTKAMMPLDATKSYGYANSEDVVSGVSYAENVFTIASVEGSEDGYTISDASGRYYYQEEGTTYKTFNVGTDASLPGCVWTISVNEDGAFTIKNAASGKYIRFAEGTYTSFGAYAEDEFNGSVAVALVDASNASARPVLNISKNVSVDSDVTTCSIEVTSNLSWTATPSEGVTLDKASGEGNATVVMTFAANEASESVTRTVTFEAGGLSKTFTLTHKAPVVAGQSRTVVFDVAEYGFANQTALESYTVDGVNFVFDGGGNNNSPKYYNSGTAVRCYPKNTITISGATIKKVTVIAPDGYTNAIDLYEDSTKLTDFTWEGSKENLVLTFDASKSSGQSRFVKIEVVCE